MTVRGHNCMDPSSPPVGRCLAPQIIPKKVLGSIGNIKHEQEIHTQFLIWA